MNSAAFFAALRARNSGVFGPRLGQRQVEGIEALLDAGADLPLPHMANVLGQVYRETGGGMYPVKETVLPHHKDKNPSDAEVIRRLDKAFAEGKLPWVRTPYWRDGAFGRGQIQATHLANYLKFGITNFDDALKLPVSARIAVEGMRDGKFTGKKLADYTFPAALDAPPDRNPRRIVNGKDGSDAEVARFHRAFAAALVAGGWQGAAPAYPIIATIPPRAPEATASAEAPLPPLPAPEPKGGLLAAILRILARIFGGKS
jgi:hypothetical protein